MSKSISSRKTKLVKQYQDMTEEEIQNLLEKMECRNLTPAKGNQLDIPQYVPWSRKIPCKVLCMSATAHYWLGIMIHIDLLEIQLAYVSWIPNIGRHHAVLQSGLPDEHTEIEPHDPRGVSGIPRNGTVIMDWNFDLWTDSR